MNGTSAESVQMISEALSSATFSQESADGRLPYDLLDGLTINQSGQDLHHVRMSVSPERSGMCVVDSVEYGPAWREFGEIWLSHFGHPLYFLKTFQVSRSGLPRSREVWRMLATLFPDRTQRLVVLVRLICAGGCGWLPTLTARDWKNPGKADHSRLSASRGEPLPETFGEQITVQMAAWLMGYPPEWLECMPLVTRSSRKSLPRS